MRAVGRGQKVLMVQFIKGPWRSGEEFAGITDNRQQTTDNGKRGSFELRKMGLGFVGILGDQLPKEEHAKAAQEALYYSKLQLKNYDMLILDEVNVAVSLGLISAVDVLNAINEVNENQIVILTGRDASQEFIDRADLVTEMKEMKHPFNKGQLGKLNIEF